MTLLMTWKWLRERRTRFLLCALLLLAGAGIAAMLLPPASPISKANYQRITKGMTEEEVTQILGPPTGHGRAHRVGANWGRTVFWRNGTHEIAVFFPLSPSDDEKDHAILKGYCSDPTMVQRLLHSIGLTSGVLSDSAAEHLQ